MRCKQCDTVWLVSGPEAAAAAPTGERRAAVVKRGTDREKRDLFAPTPMDRGSVRETLRPPPPAALSASGDDSPQSVGARNESSVLFTVDALRGAPSSKAPYALTVQAPAAPAPEMSPRIAAAPVDDDGIIDLNALASVPPRRGAEVPSLFPSEPPPGAFARDADQSSSFAAQSRSRKKYVAFGGIAGAVALAVIGIALLFRGPAPTPVSAAAPPPPVAADPPKNAAADAAPMTTTTSSDATASNDKSDDDSKPHKKGGGHRGKWSKGAGGGGGGGTSQVSLPKPKPAGGSDPCGCHGDFNCQLRCSAKGK